MLERREKILEMIRTRDRVNVRDLADCFMCSEVTIRTDLREMEKEGLLERTHGGAVRKKNVFPNYRPGNIYRNAGMKEKIAACAFRLIRARETIILDDSTACFYLALEIRRHPEKPLAVVTNSLLAGSELAGLPHVDIYVVGGTIGGHVPATFGKSAADDIRRFTVDRAFIGVYGISFEAGITAVADPQMQMKQAILETTEDITVLADSNRFGGGYFSVVCPISRISRIVTDSGVSGDCVQKAAAGNIPLIIA